MQTDTSVIIAMVGVDAKTKQKSVSRVNTLVPTSVLLEWSKKLVHMTNNSYVSTTRVDKIRLD